MHNKFLIPAAIIAMLFGGSVWAQPANSLKDAVERAVLNNPEVRFRHQNLLAMTGEQDAAKGGWYPKIDLSVESGNKSSLTPVAPSSDSYTNSKTKLELRQMLFDGFSTNLNVNRLGHSRLASYYELLSASDQIALSATGAYIDVLRYRELVTLARDNYTNHADVHARVEDRVNAGVGRRVDLEQAAGRLALAESNWGVEVSNLRDVSIRYQRVVGEAPADVLQPAPNLTKALPSRNKFVENTVHNNPDFLGAVSTLRAYRAEAKLRESPNYPTLEFVASQSSEINRSGSSGYYRDNAVQLVLNYNLYRGGSDSARIRQYAAKLNSAFYLRDKTCRDVRQTALIALNDVIKLEEQIGLLAQHKLATIKAREAYRQQFDIGQRSLLDLLDTENELFQSRRSLTNAEEDYQLAKARVLAINGSLLPTLQLRPIQNEVPPLAAGTEVNDDELLCNTALPEQITLDRFTLPLASAPRITVTPLVAQTVAPPVAAPPVPDKSSCQSITPAVEKWIAAWSKKDINGYFSSYSDAFVPAQNLNRAQWETLRKQRISKQSSISIVAKNIMPTQCNSKTSQVSFTQEYGSDDYRDSIEKTLSMEYVNGQWKILRETVTKGRTF
jgi:adhesin transport system outer membrane protein